MADIVKGEPKELQRLRAEHRLMELRTALARFQIRQAELDLEKSRTAENETSCQKAIVEQQKLLGQLQ